MEVFWFIDRALPTLSEIDFLLNDGWDQVPPRPLPHPPLRCVARVLDFARDADVRVETADAWVDTILVPTQRTWVCLRDELDARVRCASFTILDGVATAVLIRAHDEERLTYQRDAAVERASLSPDVKEMVRQCDAMSVNVSYLAGAPVVTGVNVHELPLLRPWDMRGGLPSDVRYELLESLIALGVRQLRFGDQLWTVEDADFP